MGAAARQIADSRRAPAARPHLRLVPTAPRRRTSVRASRNAVGLFRICCIAMVALACVGMLRVALAVQAEEAAIDAISLREDIRSEELAGKSLEADASALKAPSRIEAIAGTALNMTEAQQVTYIDIPAVETEIASTSAPAPTRDSGVGAVVSRIMDLAAGEAQVLLVGDVGLSSR
ncbi:MAG: hypothetical protein D9V44_04675 [Actinobacteria bacterium]|nr:MAG: hypothetical protein D9V44_04675 [Actinomycetota bacterium]